MKNFINRLGSATGHNAMLCHMAVAQIKKLKSMLELVPGLIDATKFKEATGHDPVDDDLDRSNCNKRGLLHSQCGWCDKCDKPFFYCGGIHEEPPQPAWYCGGCGETDKRKQCLGCNQT